MDSQELERVIREEVQKVLAERQRGEESLLPPVPSESIDPHACRSPSCSLSDAGSPASTPAAAARPSAPGAAGFVPAVLCLFTGGREQWEALIAAFHSWKSQGMYLHAVFSSGARDIFSPDEIRSLGFDLLENPLEIWSLMDRLNAYQAVFLPSISRTHAAKLALGITDSITLNLTLAALAQNVPTYASDEGLAPTACIVCGNQVPGIQEVLRNYRTQLAKMGLKLLSTPEAVEQVQRQVICQVESGSDLITTLITEEEAQRLSGPVVKVARGGLVTPLALDLLHRRGIEVKIVPKTR